MTQDRRTVFVTPSDDLDRQSQDAASYPGAVAMLVHGDAVALDDTGSIALVPADSLQGAEISALVGRLADGRAVFAFATDGAARSGFEFRSLRTLGGDLDEASLRAAVTAISLGRWLVGHRFCPKCGAQLQMRRAGWARQCPACGAEHFPRNDPAVIVAVTDRTGDRILLGANAAWGGTRFSCFAGFGEAGEALEDTVRREVAEEAGVQLVDVEYQQSQPWPYPHSLMIGFRAVARDDMAARPDGSEITAVRWCTREEIGRALTGEEEFSVPGPGSIARKLIEAWVAEG